MAPSERAELANPFDDLVGPGPPGLEDNTFLDEMWRPQRAKSPDHSSSQPQPIVPYYLSIPAHTMAERASGENVELRASSTSVSHYQERKLALYKKRRYARDDWLKAQPNFNKFPALPLELRRSIWNMAMEELTAVHITCTKLRVVPRGRSFEGHCCYDTGYATRFVATAVLPPFFLVNHEAHDIAKQHYRRAFRSVGEGGGVLAKYPTVLSVDPEALELLVSTCSDDFELISELVLTRPRDLGETVVRYNYEDNLVPFCRTSNLERIKVELTHWWELESRHNFREACSQAVLSSPRKEALEIEITVDLPSARQPWDDGGEESLYFKGSIHDLPCPDTCLCLRSDSSDST
ncbi:hypothetical protein F5Y16DRAFT_80472 [Xylariaceae sp. FL0255]|nr:hypothetical protein F5Y16DRAFT_80472 [Xylariaceae sp. FL0255]